MSETKSITPPDGARQIPFAPGYMLVDGGVVWSSRSRHAVVPWHIKRPCPPDKKSGHIRIWLSINGKSECFYVHALVLEVFKEPCPPGLECRHLDGNPANNFVYNLVWGTRAENIADMKRHGTDLSGEKHPFARLTEVNIVEIFRLASQGMPQWRIGEIYGVHQAHISGILLRKFWPDVEIPAEYLYMPHQHPESAPKGEQHGMAMLKDSSVVEVFRLRSEGMTLREIAERIGMSRPTVSMILLRKTWKHVLIPAEYLLAPQ
jgi:predicted DNA-binding protein (UPF0251 family)